jgi:diphthamide biosynthesis protein 4
MNYMPTYYEILGLPKSLENASAISAQTLRGAYRRALLQNHPDKSTIPGLNSKKTTYSIDQISEAFSTLSNPTSRAEYDKGLRLREAITNGGGVNGREVFRTGVETVDLDDLDVNEAQGIWYRSCRCGDARGFLIMESDLEEAADEGELSVGCRGCSLWLKVLFGTMEEEAQDEADN